MKENTLNDFKKSYAKTGGYYVSSMNTFDETIVKIKKIDNNYLFISKTRTDISLRLYVNGRKTIAILNAKMNLSEMEEKFKFDSTDELIISLLRESYPSVGELSIDMMHLGLSMRLNAFPNIQKHFNFKL